MNKKLITVAVDLTPVLPGGENGGAKVLVLELLNLLAEMQPQTQFILLTQIGSHDELAYLDRPNMRRYIVLGAPLSDVVETKHPLWRRIASRVFRCLPATIRGLVIRFIHQVIPRPKAGKTISLLKGLGVQLLFCPFTSPTYAEPGIASVCTLYDLQHKTYPQFFTADDVVLRDRIYADTFSCGAALIAVSDYTRASALLHGNLNSNRIHTIYPRMSQRIRPRGEDDKRILVKLRLNSQRYFLFPANFWKHKNHEMLLTAFGIAAHKGLAADFKLVCTGAPTPRRDELIKAANVMGLADRVVFPGYLPNEELATVMAHTKGVIFPSLYEGFGLPVIEAMAAGVPVACSNTTSLPEVALDAAILFDPRVPTQIAEVLLTLENNDVLCAKLIQAGLKRAEEFSDSRRMAKEYWALFEGEFFLQQNTL